MKTEKFLIHELMLAKAKLEIVKKGVFLNSASLAVRSIMKKVNEELEEYIELTSKFFACIHDAGYDVKTSSKPFGIVLAMAKESEAKEINVEKKALFSALAACTNSIIAESVREVEFKFEPLKNSEIKEHPEVTLDVKESCGSLIDWEE